MDPFESEREAMVREQLERRGLANPRVLDAIRAVPRHLFVKNSLLKHAYADRPLTIGHYQTISQPYVVALMCDRLKLEETDRVLEIGTGSGYAAAVLAQLCERVVTVERIPELAKRARETLAKVDCRNVTVHCSDGTLGRPEEAPFDAILVSAAAPAVPETYKQQLCVGGRLVIPAGRSRSSQSLYRVRKKSDSEFAVEDLGGVAFVPLIGEKGWQNG
ncbi:MAG: protein-L-isoaspartate(D-aspartate) O-methyltransferase [Roseibium sp.]|uniref:protein-L-isoaspartate(D-aspartate) O-methyltransferase n=1 Tax=Roseibium sp. TaxID=1936156 RepID=UPI003D9C29F1